MKFHSSTEKWDFSGAMPVFSHMVVIFQEGNNYFSLKSKERRTPSKEPDSISAIRQDKLDKIPYEHIWPFFDESFTKCADIGRDDLYIKQPRLTGYNGTPALSSYLLQEALVCEFLKHHAHRNIAQYRGCSVTDDRITGLCYQKYAETLAERIRRGRPIDKEGCLSQVKAGVSHLHALGLIHNDIHSDNIMFVDKESDELVIIDFDSCVGRGNLLPAKHGEVPDDAGTAEDKNDELCVGNLEKELGLDGPGY